MKALWIAGVACVAGALFVAPLVSQEGEGMAPQPLGREHQELAKAVGTWNYTMKHWMMPGEPQTAQGTARFEPVMGGRFVRQLFKCDNMMGQPFEGEGLLGYDLNNKKYVSTWIDTFTTEILYSEGTASQDGKVITFTGEMTGPGGMKSKYRNVQTVIGPDETKFEMFSPGPDGKEVRAMEIIYKRAAKN